MRKRILAIAPHPDDETLGCGGTLLRHRAAGDEIHWGIATAMAPGDGWDRARMERREEEIRRVSEAFGFASVVRLGLPAGRLDVVARKDLVASVGRMLDEVAPDTVYLPHRGDAHSDHRAVFAAAVAACKIFRRPGVARILSYEVVSETDVVPVAEPAPFSPDVFVDVEFELERKLGILALYEGETAPPPFPRSPEALRAQALLRGGQCGCVAAEAFQLLRDVWGR